MTGIAPISVQDEFAPLKEVFVGRFERDSVIPPVSYSIAKYCLPETIDMIHAHVGKSLQEVAPELAEAGYQQLEGLVKVYEDSGVIVHRPRHLTEPEREFVVRGENMVYARDPMLVIGNRVIETSLMMPYRRKEIFAYREALGWRIAADENAAYVAMPHPTPTVLSSEVPDGPGPFLEGGDVFLMGQDILVGNSGLATNRAGIDWLQRLLRPEGYRVHEVPLTDKWLHLDCIFAVIRPGLAMCHMDGLADGLPDLVKDWEIIEATEEEAHVMGCNTVCLAPNRVLIAQEHTRLIDEMERRNVEVVSCFDLNLISMLGGGVRCATHPVVRAYLGSSMSYLPELSS